MRNENTSFVLWCLVCGAGEGQIQQRNPSPLVAMQEHLMQEHGLEQRDFEQTIRHTIPTTEGACYEWSLPTGHPLIEELHLSEGRIMRACRPGACDPQSTPCSSGEAATSTARYHPFDERFTLICKSSGPPDLVRHDGGLRHG